MRSKDKDQPALTPDAVPPLAIGRRGFLAAAGSLAALAGAAAPREAEAAVPVPPTARAGTEPFWGQHQGGILTLPQDHTYFAVFDLTTAKLSDIVELMRRWTEASSRMCAGQTAAPLGTDLTVAGADSGEALGLPPARLTITFGFGPGLFSHDGVDRFGLASRRPEAFVDLPGFIGDQLVPEKTGGDLSVQACGDDPQVVFHAVRQLARMADGVARIKWVQTGFARNSATSETPRNLMGFKDGTINPDTKSDPAMNQVVWIGAEGPAWAQGGSYAVVRRIRITLEHWDRTEVDFQEQVFGRHKYSGAPLGKQHEFEDLGLERMDKDGNPIIASNAHARLGAPQENKGAQMLRRGYSYNDGANFYVERWPPWRQQLEYDSGLLFFSYQKDPRTSFIPVFKKMAALDALNQFTTHVGSGIFLCPPGATGPGRFVGDALFQGVTQTKIYPVAQPAVAPAGTKGATTY
jgi:deferrochelatase/peroxidase EfeB